MGVLKREYVKKVKSIQVLHTEKDGLLDKAAKDEFMIDRHKETQAE